MIKAQYVPIDIFAEKWCKISWQFKQAWEENYFSEHIHLLEELMPKNARIIVEITHVTKEIEE